MSLILNYNNWLESSSINENISAAKQMVLNSYAMSHNITRDQIEDPSDVLNNNEDYVEVLHEITQANLKGLMFPFLRFKTVQLAPITIIQELLKSITDQRVNRHLKELPMSIEAYAKIPYKEPNPGVKQGYELLGDALIILTQTLEGRWIYDRMSSSAGFGKFNQREAFRNADQDLKNEILLLAGQLIKLDKDSPGSSGTVDAFKSKLPAITSLSDIKRELVNKIDGIGSDINKRIDKIDLLGEEGRVIWKGDNKFISVFHTAGALGDFCADSSWCIRPSRIGSPGGSWNSYVKEGSVQYVLFDYSVSQTDPKSMIGITVEPDGRISSSHFKNDKSASGTLGGQLSSSLEWIGVSESQIKQLLSLHTELSNVNLKNESRWKLDEDWLSGKMNVPKYIKSLLISETYDTLELEFNTELNKRDIPRYDRVKKLISDGDISSLINEVQQSFFLEKNKSHWIGIPSVRFIKILKYLFNDNNISRISWIKEYAGDTELSIKKYSDMATQIDDASTNVIKYSGAYDSHQELKRDVLIIKSGFENILTELSSL
jgi:hypothetical protein